MCRCSVERTAWFQSLRNITTTIDCCCTPPQREKGVTTSALHFAHATNRCRGNWRKNYRCRGNWRKNYRCQALLRLDRSLPRHFHSQSPTKAHFLRYSRNRPTRLLAYAFRFCLPVPRFFRPLPLPFLPPRPLPPPPSSSSSLSSAR